MASEAVLQWITRDMKLYKVVTTIETDFSNGYLFGEILNRFQLVDDMTSFTKKTSKESKVKNFQQVEQVLRQIKVKFDGKLIHQIMNEERGAALRLLYQMKLGIEKSDIGGIDASKKTMSNLKPDIVTKRYDETLTLKATLPTLVGAGKLSTINRSNKLAPIEKSMLPFEHRKMMFEQKAFDDQRKEEDLLRSLYQQARQDEHRKLDENKEFMQDWMKEGHQNWKINQKRRGDAIARVQYFEDREVKAYKDRLGKELDEATRELMGGVDEFEKNLQKLGIEKNTNIEEAIKKMEEKKGIPPGQIQNFSYAATMNKIKEKKSMLDFAVKERDRRRRKMVVDQAKTQSGLDKKKSEEQLIEKLLKQQAEEHKMAYLEQRQVRCKELIIEARRVKAVEAEVKRKAQIEELERKRAETMPQQVKKHISDIQERKKDFQGLRREEKAKKRALNVEICSEVIDLIMDIANEAYDEQQNSQSHKLDKPLWREYMKHFKDGKLASKARRGLLNQDTGTFLVAISPQKTHEDEVDVLNDLKKPISEVIDTVQYDQCYTDLLEYLSTSGIFNLTDGRFEEWLDFPSFDTYSSLLSQRLPPTNPEIGRTIHKIFAKQHRTNPVTQIEGIPSYLTLKLCLLGRASAGKRTTAKQIVDLYPKVKAFRMDELIKEVVEYVSPKVVVAADAAADKGKKAPPPKGKVEEAAPVDPYAGFDTKEYKEIGLQIKKYVCGSDGQGELPVGQDQTALVPDEKLLVQLFIQKLKLTFPADKTEEAKLEEIKQGLAKEKELLEQLAELEAANAAGADPKAAPKGKAPPPKGGKGAGGPSGEEQIRADLEAIQKVQPEGWILLDFPRTLQQAKAMEGLMAGFVSTIDTPDNKSQKDFELWSKLVTPVNSIGKGAEVLDYNGEPFIYQSATDGYLFLDVPSEECQRRVTNRKIDPTTGIIYHMEDSPPPEGDPKLKDRLQDYHGEPDTDPARIQHQNSLYSQNADQLKKWAATFALNEPSLDRGVNLLIEVPLQEKLKKEEVLDRVQKQVGKVLAFKQALFDQRRQRVRTQHEAPVINEGENLDGEQKAVEEPVQEEEREAVKSRNGMLEAGQLTQSKKSGLTKGTHEIFSGTQRSTATFKEAQPLSSTQKALLYNQFQADYYRESLQVFRAVRQQRVHVFEGLTQMQTHFIESYLSRIDTRQTSLVQDFVDSFNKFSEEFPNLRSDPLTQEELRKRVTRLSNDMWTLVEQKKDQALDQHAKLNSDGWVVSEIRNLMKNACRVIQLELQRVFVLQSLVTGVVIQLEIELDRTLENLSDDGVKTIDESEQSPLFDQIISYALRIIQSRREVFETQLEHDQRGLLEIELQTCLYRINLVRTWVMLKVKEFNQFWRQLYEVLDDGIVTAIQIENQATQSVIHKISEHMQEQQMTGIFHPMDYSDFRIPYLDLESSIQRIDFTNAEVPLYQQRTPLPTNPHDQRLKLGQIGEIYTSLRYYAYEEYLEVSTFINQMVLLFQQGALPHSWREFDFSVFSQIACSLVLSVPGKEVNIYSSTPTSGVREFFDWKKLMTMFILEGAPLPSNRDIDHYQSELLQKADEQGLISLEGFSQAPAWFDDFESVAQDLPLMGQSPDQTVQDDDEEGDGILRDKQRLISIKAQLFNVHQMNTKVVRVSSFIKVLSELRTLASNGHENFYSYLFLR